MATECSISSPANGSGRIWIRSSIRIRMERRCCTSIGRFGIQKRRVVPSSCPSSCTTARASVRMRPPWISTRTGGRRSSRRPNGARSSSGINGTRVLRPVLRVERGDVTMRLLQLTAIGLAGAAVVAAQAPKPATDWGSHGHDAGARRYSPLKQINTGNVSALQLAWTYDTPAAVPPGPSRGGPAPAPEGSQGEGSKPDAPARPAPRQSASTPLVVDGVMYMATAYNRIVALDADTGKEIWVKNIGQTPSTRGIAYWPGTRDLPAQLVFGTADGSSLLIALNAKTGEFVPGFGEGGKVDLRQGVGEKFPKLRVALSSPPAIYRHLAITGAHSQEAPSFGPSGDVRAWDLRTGKIAWTFHTIPRPGEPNHEAWKDNQWADRAGANAWGFITVDEARGIAYIPLGTPSTDFYGGDRLGSNLYGSSLLALDAATGKLKWYFQTTHHDNWDYDLSSPPALIDVRR
ncbi:MAG: hypothetical protein EHM55_24325, partial [Acidobacteria bacterium]